MMEGIGRTIRKGEKLKRLSAITKEIKKIAENTYTQFVANFSFRPECLFHYDDKGEAIVNSKEELLKWSRSMIDRQSSLTSPSTTQVTCIH